MFPLRTSDRPRFCCTKLTNNALRRRCYSDNALVSARPPQEALQGTNLKRFIRTFEALTDLGPELTADRDFRQTARTMLTAVMEAAGATGGRAVFVQRTAVFADVGRCAGFRTSAGTFCDSSASPSGALLDGAVGPVALTSSTYDSFLSSNGNVAPELFKCICPLKVRGKLAGLIALGRRPGDALYEEDELDAFQVLSHYVALAVQNHTLSQTLAQRVSENLRLLASLHGFYDNALEAFAIAIDVKHVNIHGHSLRVGRYAQAIGEALGMDPSSVASLRSAAIFTTSAWWPSTGGFLEKRLDWTGTNRARCATTP
jgi:hypothetical protein